MSYLSNEIIFCFFRFHFRLHSSVFTFFQKISTKLSENKKWSWLEKLRAKYQTFLNILFSIESKLKLLTFLFGFQKSFLTRNSKNINFASVNYIHFPDFWDRLIFARFFLSSVEFSKQRQKSNSIRSLKTKYSVQ